MPFFECEFPRQIGFVSSGGDTFQTQINTGFGGVEQRNRAWVKGRKKFQVPLNGKTFDYFALVRAFFLNVAGKADAFRLYWPLDNCIIGQNIGTGTGAVTAFQLKKTYSVGGRTYTYVIKKPIMATVQDFQGNFLTNTVKMYVDGVLKTLGTHYSVDATTGIVTFVSAPAAGKAVTADAQFHIPVRFDTDSMETVQILSQDLKVKWPNVTLIEDRQP